MAENSKQTIITAVSIVVALAAIVYALMTKVEKPTVTATVPSIEVTEITYEVSSDNPVVMTIGDKQVTRMEVLDNFASSGSQLPPGANIEEIFPLLQDQYLVGELLKQAALDNGYTKDTPAIAQRLNTALDQALRAEYIKDLGDNKVTEDDVQKAYDDIVKNAPDVEERRARHILVSDETKANALIAQLNDGASFEDLARENSEGPTGQNGGDLGYFAQSEMVPEFANAAFSMNVGEVSAEPVQTQFGFHVIKVEDVRTRAKPAFEDIKAQIEGQLRQAVISEEIQKIRQQKEITAFDFNGDPLPVADEQNNASDVTEDSPESEMPSDQAEE
jgi:peptidyl-prolyl cis-trans isomerase C